MTGRGANVMFASLRFACRRWGLLFILTIGVLTTPPAESKTPTVETLRLAQLEAIVRQHRHCVLVFLAAWCHPCIEELPALKAIDRKFGPDGLKIVGVSIDYGGPEAIRPVVDQAGIQFPVYWTGEAAIEKFAIKRIPLMLFFREGRLVHRLTGQRDASALASEIRAFLGGE
jgi:cytochrome c biogenesis protein CcmG/thiol:disulfide interchange protein DsbE